MNLTSLSGIICRKQTKRQALTYSALVLITRKRLAVLADEGLLEKSEEKVVVSKVPIKRKRTTYSISDKANRLLKVCETSPMRKLKTSSRSRRTN